ncbi:hypothetical protein BN7_1745 [Wickerhamomyces ciferrii]|uniref:Protein arginine N-methyltransferase n=1 Tax=Wickerhamomyces ciferrii (strain ATCC 14091 / BCRC 22168 / CBS 111 / JCM 3599 / NBRC 0793 / NRRL Y-1031 F-60-10) TaxID=1206466 RepID=K0KGU6_WICCF|nr:uncharacterized protein BN7_1745 [Wickerhamomyces ciferrii]CCH42201.1 hypothetical protein BN7_1745 [Wickerhamomyces ciferrii]
MSNDLGSPYIGVKPALSTKATAGTNSSLVEQYVHFGYDQVLLSITNAHYREKSRKVFQKAKRLVDITIPSPSLTDVNIFAGPHVQNTIGLLSSWIELESEDELISEFSKQVMIKELEYAKFIGINHLIMAPPKNLIKLANYSKSVNDALDITQTHNITISISLPLCEEITEDSFRFQPIDSLSTWDMWNSIRTSCDYNQRLKISLAIPKSGIPINVVERWFAEPVSILLMSSSIFILNNKGYPVLSKTIQTLLHHFHIKKPLYLLHGLEKVPEEVDSSSYMKYINYILVRNQAPLNIIDKVSKNHQDVLLPPLQPLATNLDDFTYSIFEKDDVKYDVYGKAIYSALSDLSHLHTINIAIVGAGKGGLVEQVVKAVRKLQSSSNISITAIEKNTSAVIYLQKRNFDDWNQSVDILNIDMREWSPKESHNIIVSELLGSMGCNELSPECLEPLEKYLDRENGVFIPQSYTSFIAPTFSPKIYNSIRSKGGQLNFHKQYVVKQLESASCSTKINEIWSYQHPTIKERSNKRRTISTFKIRHKTVIHGISGYFTTNLYNDIELSIKPDTHTENLTSWFPLFFPLEEPLYVPDDTELEVFITRESSNGKVWYEWSVESFMYLVVPGDNSNEFQIRVRTGMSKIHNQRGKGFVMNLNFE